MNKICLDRGQSRRLARDIIVKPFIYPVHDVGREFGNSNTFLHPIYN